MADTDRRHKRMPTLGGNPQEIVDYLNRYVWDRYAALRRPWLKQVEANVRNLAGHQYDEYIESAGEFVDLSKYFVPEDERWRTTPVFNWLREAWFRLSLAKLTENIPVLGALPASPDQSDALTASLFDPFFKYEWSQMGMPENLFKHYGWVLTAGESVLMLRWDPSKGERQDFYGPSAPDVGGQMNALTEAPYIWQDGQLQQGGPEDAPHTEQTGDFTCDVLAPTSVLFPYGPEPHWAKRWVMREYLLPVEEVEDRFDIVVEPDAFQVEDDVLLKMDYSSYYGNPASPEGWLQYFAAQPSSVSIDGMVRLRERWERACPQYPHGRLTIVTKSQQLYDDVNPFVVPGVREKVIVPIFRFACPDLPFRQEGGSSLESLIPVARARNRVLAGFMDYVDRNQQPTEYVNRNLVADDQLENLNEPGGKVMVDGDPNMASAYAQIPNFPPAGRELSDTLLNELGMLGHYSGAGTGTVPNDSRSGELLAQDRFDSDRPWGATLRLASWEWARFGQAMIDMAAVCMEDERILAIAGEDSALTFLTVRGELFQGRANIVALPESAVLETRQDKQNRITQLLGTVAELRGADPTGQLADVMLETMNYPSVQRALRPGGEAYTLAQRQVAEMVQTGRLAPVLPEQDHGVHVSVVSRFMQGQTFRDLPDARKLVLRIYKQLHEIAGAQVAIQEAGQAAQVAGAVGQIQVAAQAPAVMQQAALQQAVTPQEETMGTGAPTRGPKLVKS